jgi:hypothetical protein
MAEHELRNGNIGNRHLRTGTADDHDVAQYMTDRQWILRVRDLAYSLGREED